MKKYLRYFYKKYPYFIYVAVIIGSIVAFASYISYRSEPIFSPPAQSTDSQRINTTIKQIPFGKYRYQNSNSAHQTSFSKNPTSPAAIHFANQHTGLSFFTNSSQAFAKANTKTKPVANNNIVTYPALFPDTDLRYTIEPSRLLEEFIVHKRATALSMTEITQTLDRKNIDSYQEVGGAIELYRDQQLVATIPRPVMYEMNDRTIRSYELSYSIKEINDNTLQITKIINQEGQAWLADPKRQYPIAIDLVIDNADAAVNWVSSDPANTSVSQETSLKHSGTGSVKVQTTSGSLPLDVDLFEYDSDHAARASAATNTISATGGTITYSGGYTIHTFTSSGTFTVSSGSDDVEVLVVGGGGSGGNYSTTNANGGGGGGGVIHNTAYAVTPTGYTVTVGNGGAAIPNATNSRGNTGENSVFGTLTALGGGGGGSTGSGAGRDGGSGGGGTNNYTGGSASQPGGYANAGGTTGITWTGSGGGGAGSVGVPGANTTTGGNGGTGYISSISGTTKYYAGGGGGGGNSSERAGDGFDGGGRGTGTTSYYAYNVYTDEVNSNTRGSGIPTAIANTGGGGGAGSYWAPNGGWSTGSGAGGSGIVIVRYPTTGYTQTGFISNASLNATGGEISYSGGYTIHTFTSSDKFTVTSGSGDVEVLVVGGGGSGGNRNTTNANGGGGGGGVIYDSAYAVTAQDYPITIGKGGAAVSGISRGNNGGSSVFGTLTALGGGGGGSTGVGAGLAGGSGGGGTNNYGGGSASQPGGYANAGGTIGITWTGSGGGGAGSAGVAGANTSTGGNGGTGYTSSISGNTQYYGGGGGGGGNSSERAGDGFGGGGRGTGTTSYYNYNVYTNELNNTTHGSGIPDAIPNTGGGGGGGSYWAASGGWSTYSGAGADGTVIIRYPTPPLEAFSSVGFVATGGTITTEDYAPGGPITDTSLNATGGEISYSGGYKIHTFYEGVTNFNVLHPGNVEILVVGGGGSGGNHSTTNANGGGGGGGVIYNASYAVTAQSYPVDVGYGGVAIANATNSRGNTGENSVFGTLTALGGGGGGSTGSGAGRNGGSGGGGTNNYTGGSASQPGGYANAGGTTGITWTGSGGGGAGSAGVPGANDATGGNGGTGYTSSISGTTQYYAGGGGGGGNSSERAGDGFDGGGRGCGTTSYYAYNVYTDEVNGTTHGRGIPTAVPNTGGGGGGGSYWAPNGGWSTGSGAGASGIVIIKYPTPSTETFSSAGFLATGDTTTYNDTIHTFTSSGTFAVTSGSSDIQTLVVGGGGSGGNRNTTNANGGGGGGGVIYNTSFPAKAQSYPVTVGYGGVAIANVTNSRGNIGGNSFFNTLTALGGGGGGSSGAGAGRDGGSGGGGTNNYRGGGAIQPGGYANYGGTTGINYTGSGGGGAGGGGVFGRNTTTGGNGGTGYTSFISGTTKYYAGGGGGGSNSTQRAGDGFDGGGRGFGATSYYAYNVYTDEVNSNTNGRGIPTAVPNTGGGGGAGSYWAPNGGWTTGSGAGGSGIVIVRYPTANITTVKSEGSYALKGVARTTTSLNKTLTRTIASPYDFDNTTTAITFDIRASRTGSNIKVGLHDSGGTTTEITPNITVADTFQEVTIDLSGVSGADKDAIDQIIITIINADEENTFFIDNMKSVIPSSITDTVTLTKSPTDLSDTPSINFWVRSDTTGSFARMQFGESDSSEQTHNFTIDAANTWEQKLWDISGITGTDRDAVTKFAFEITAEAGGAILYFDYLTGGPPNTPSLDTPTDTATNQSLTPIMKTTATDDGENYLRYKIQVCENVGMTTNCNTHDQTSSQTGWSGQDTQSSTAYASGTQATYTLQTSLSASTTYYWRSYAIDPGGSNTWGSTQGTPYSFTTTTIPTAPTTPYAEGSTNPTGVIDLTPEFSAIHNDPNSDAANYYQVEVNTAVGFDGTTMWDSGKSSMTSTANGVRSPDISYAGTELSWDTTYYWRIKFWDTLGAQGTVSATQNFKTNVPVASPILDSPSDTAIDVAILPALKTTSTDVDSDYLRYKIEVCENEAMTLYCNTYDQTSSQTGWSGQDAQTSTAYASGTQATYTLQIGSELNELTAYYWRSYAIDPAGSNAWSSTQSTPYSFTTVDIPTLSSGCRVQETNDDSSLTVIWSDISDDEDNYEVERSVDGGGWADIATGLAADTTSYQDSTITTNHTYRYRVAPYFDGPVYGTWCNTDTLSISLGTFKFENINFE
jgi:hypothetical protein